VRIRVEVVRLPATTGIQLTAWEIGLWAVLLMCAVALTVNAVRKVVIHGASDGGHLALQGPLGHRDRDLLKEPDAIFWNIFAGLVVVVPAVVIPALASPAVGLLMLFLVITAAVAAFAVGRNLEQRRQDRSGFTEAAARHDAILARWQSYELDPAKGIDFPGMSDVNVPQTAALVRALQEAQRCRLTAGADYAGAVEQLEVAMAQAEAAAGVSAP
jgi:ABC-type multidrug transport system fused ATPase/permease subunit